MFVRYGKGEFKLAWFHASPNPNIENFEYILLWWPYGDKLVLFAICFSLVSAIYSFIYALCLFNIIIVCQQLNIKIVTNFARYFGCFENENLSVTWCDISFISRNVNWYFIFIHFHCTFSIDLNSIYHQHQLNMNQPTKWFDSISLSFQCIDVKIVERKNGKNKTKTAT